MFTIALEFLLSGHGNRVPKILRTLNFQQVHSEIALLISHCISYQLIHTSSQTEDAKKRIDSSM